MSSRPAFDMIFWRRALFPSPPSSTASAAFWMRVCPSSVSEPSSAISPCAPLSWRNFPIASPLFVSSIRPSARNSMRGRRLLSARIFASLPACSRMLKPRFCDSFASRTTSWTSALPSGDSMRSRTNTISGFFTSAPISMPRFAASSRTNFSRSPAVPFS